jgi:hypothetical protein
MGLQKLVFGLQSSSLVHAITEWPMLCLLHLFVAVCVSAAAVLHVPDEYPTIQVALNSTQPGDTVLVALGIYAEALSGPPHSFLLKGDVIPDTGLYERPVIDPSPLPSPTTLSCLRSGPSGTPVIEDVTFRNGPPMFPRDEPIPGGIETTCRNTILRRCVFDSTILGVRCDSDSVVLEGCHFVDYVRWGIRVLHGLILATDCSFDGHSVNTVWGLVFCTSGSSFTRCRFTYRESSDQMLYVIGHDCTMRECLVGPISHRLTNLILATLDNSIYENNVITACSLGTSVFSFGGSCEGPGVVRNNRFVGIAALPDEPHGGWGINVLTENSPQPCPGATIEDNLFEGNPDDFGHGIIFSSGPITIRHNRFTGLKSAPLSGAVTIIPPDTIPEWPHLMLDNLCYSNVGCAAYGAWETTLHAPNNWWGDPAGPYNAAHHPAGLGDTVGDFVEFTPWHTDTTFFWEAAEEPPMLLPREVTMEIFPQPFNAQATLRLTVNQPMILKVELFNLLGQREEEIWSGAIGIRKEISFNGMELASGLYFVRAYDILANRPAAMTKVVALK